MSQAEFLRETASKEALDPWGTALFPMYVAAIEAVLKMTNLKPHETLLMDRVVKDFEDCSGNALFVSHQWAGLSHPDPTFEQFKVLQEALRHMSKTPSVSANIGLELYTNKRPHPTEEMSKPLFIWSLGFSKVQTFSVFLNAVGRQDTDSEFKAQVLTASTAKV